MLTAEDKENLEFISKIQTVSTRFKGVIMASYFAGLIDSGKNQFPGDDEDEQADAAFKFFEEEYPEIAAAIS